MARGKNQGKPTNVETAAPEAIVDSGLVLADATPTAKPVIEAVEDVSDPSVAPVVDQPVPPAAKTSSKGLGVFFALVLGGAAAAAGGFALARYVPEGWPVNAAENADALQATVQEQAAALARLQTAITDLEAKLQSMPAEVTPGPDYGPRLDALEGRLSALENRPAVTDEAAVAALRAEIDGMKTALNAPVARVQAEVEAQLASAAAKAAAIQDQAAAEAASTRRAAAIAALRAAFDAGLPLDGPLEAARAENVTIPAEVAVETPTLVSLQASFPEAARAALAATRSAEGGGDTLSRITTFLQAQTGARSLTPKEGNSADAILSRAEAALATGDLEVALTEIAALPDVAKDPLAAWQTQAERRLSAASALTALE